MTTESPADRARQLADEARSNPDAIDLDEVAALLDADSSDARRYGIEAFRATLSADPPDAAAHVPALRDLLDDDDSLVRNGAMAALAELVVTDHESVRPAVEDAVALLDDEQDIVRSTALDFLYKLGREEPKAVGGAVPKLLTALEVDDLHQQSVAVLCLGHVARSNTEPLVPAVDRFVDLFVEEREQSVGPDSRQGMDPGDVSKLRELSRNAAQRDRDVRMAAGEVVVAVARFEPSALRSRVPDLARHLDAANPEIRGVVIDVFGAVGREHPDAIEEHLSAIADDLYTDGIRERAARALAAVSQSAPDDVAAVTEHEVDAVTRLLDHEAPAVRGTAAGLLSFVAEESPDAVDVEAVRPLLDDEHASVRGNAVWTVGFAGDDDDRERLARLAESDPDEDVRAAAESALDAA